MNPADLADLVREQLGTWSLRADGAPQHGTATVVVPVRTDDGDAAVLKLGVPRPDTEHAHLVLRRWGGHGAVRLLRADPHRNAVLLERADGPDLTSLPDHRACEVVAGLYGRLHVPAMPQLDSLTTDLERWIGDFEQLPRGAPIPHRLVDQASTLARDLVAAPQEREVVLHGDLHYGNVLAADRQPWLAISPRPVNGDRHFELAPMLWHRWDELAGNVRDGLRHRFYTLVDAAGLDEDLGRAWTLVRVVHRAVREVADGATELTRYVAIAKAVQD